MAFNLAGLSGFTDQTSFGLISQAVLGAHIMDYASIHNGFGAGTVAVNILKSTLAPAAASCGWNAAGTASFTQVSLVIADKQVKEQYCPEDLRAYWLSSQLKPGGQLEEIPFADAIANLKVKQIQSYVEQVVFQGDSSTVTGIIAGLTAGNVGGTVSGATAWTSTTALTEAQKLISAIPSAVLDRGDLVMYMSFNNFRALNQALVAANYYHYVPGVSPGAALADQTVIIPGSNVLAVPFGGMGTSQNVFVGPSEYVVLGTGLGTDYDSMDIFYDKYNDIVKFMAKFRIGVAIAFPEYFASNLLA